MMKEVDIVVTINIEIKKRPKQRQYLHNVWTLVKPIWKTFRVLGVDRIDTKSRAEYKIQ